LTNRTIRIGGLDVTDPEPLPRDHPFLKLDNVIITLIWAARRKRRGNECEFGEIAGGAGWRTCFPMD